MALRTIREEGDSLLRKKSREVKEINDSVLTLLDDMLDTMRDKEGVGLAAPQVGVLKRIILVDVGDEQGLIELINPEILEAEGEQFNSEGCLSVPGFKGKVLRPTYVKAKGLNRKGEEIIVSGEGLKAVALCHEIDHLDGVLYVDKCANIIEMDEEFEDE